MEESIASHTHSIERIAFEKKTKNKINIKQEKSNKNHWKRGENLALSNSLHLKGNAEKKLVENSKRHLILTKMKNEIFRKTGKKVSFCHVTKTALTETFFWQFKQKISSIRCFGIPIQDIISNALFDWFSFFH